MLRVYCLEEKEKEKEQKGTQGGERHLLLNPN